MARLFSQPFCALSSLTGINKLNNCNSCLTNFALTTNARVLLGKYVHQVKCHVNWAGRLGIYQEELIGMPGKRGRLSQGYLGE